MTGIEEPVREFLSTWQKRKAGELPPIDMRVTCSVCGCQVIGDEAVQFTTKGIICKGCLDKGEDTLPTQNKYGHLLKVAVRK